MVIDQIRNHQVGSARGPLVTAQTLTQSPLMSDAPRHKVWACTVTQTGKLSVLVDPRWLRHIKC